PPADPRVPARMSAYGISWAPDDPQRVYVGTDYGVAVSSDQGSTWSHRMVETTSPVSDDRLQNSVMSILALPGDRVLALCRTGVYGSDDGGGTWRNLMTGDFSGGFKCIDVSPFDSDKVFVLRDYWNLYLYEVAADTWTHLPLPGGDSRGPFVRVSRSAVPG